MLICERCKFFPKVFFPKMLILELTGNFNTAKSMILKKVKNSQ